MKKLRVFVGVTWLANYPQGGGHWAWVLQYPLGLRDLGHDVTILEARASPPDRSIVDAWVRDYFAILSRYGLEGDSRLVIYPRGQPMALDNIETFGSTTSELIDSAKSADVLINLSCSIEQPLLSLFGYRVLVDVDPGHLQISELTYKLGIEDHHRHFSVGLNVGTAGCEVPTLGLEWKPSFPVVYLPMWSRDERVADRATPITSITHWNWDELLYEGRSISISKREAYLRYLDLPRKSRRPFALAVNLEGQGSDADLHLLEDAGWSIVDPWITLNTPERYAQFIAASRAELCCAKEAFRVLSTGWISDRSAAYLASGRPVIADETGFSSHVETGQGIFAVSNVDQAVAAIEDLDARYEWHSSRAVEIARSYFDSRKVLPRLLGQ